MANKTENQLALSNICKVSAYYRALGVLLCKMLHVSSCFGMMYKLSKLLRSCGTCSQNLDQGLSWLKLDQMTLNKDFKAQHLSQRRRLSWLFAIKKILHAIHRFRQPEDGFCERIPSVLVLFAELDQRKQGIFRVFPVKIGVQTAIFDPPTSRACI